MNKYFNIIRNRETTTLKIGRKKFADITESPNKDYKFILWLKSGVALSGFETEQLAIERAERMLTSLNEISAQILSTN